MPGVGIVKTESITLPEAFALECGARLHPVTVAYETYGRLNQDGDNAILVLHALTGDAHAAGLHTPEEKLPGWWDQLIGPGQALDTERYFVICSNVLGGCYGTTGPGSLDPASGRPWGMRFPVVTIRDMVRLQRLLLEHLGVRQLTAVVGGSMGGMQALEWGVTFPEMVRNVIALACSAQLSAQGIAFNRVQREAILNDPDWREGDYYGTPGPVKGLALAREIGTITYKSDQSWNQKFGRNFGGAPRELFRFAGSFEVENYLRYQGMKLVRRFDANTYLYLTKAMDLHDVSRGYGSLEKAWARVQARTLMVGISSDFLYPPYQQREVARGLAQAGARARYVEVNSPYGHDAFLIEFERIGPIIARFLREEE